jgi:hypothetical protein
MNQTSKVICLVGVLALLFPSVSRGQAATTPGQLESYSTIYSLGVEWHLQGDDDHDASCTVSYRQQGETAWHNAMDLFRVDYTPPDPVGSMTEHFNGLSGSVLFLDPDTTYELLLNLVDPDGGSESRQTTISTRALPQKPSGSSIFHVVPGSGGGDGSEANPFQGIEFAQDHASPGALLNLHTGTYQGFDPDNEIEFNVSGATGQFIVWQAAGDGEVIFDDRVRIAADFVWIEGIHVRGHAGVDDEFALLTYSAPEYVVISRCLFTDFHYSITLNHGGANWIIIDNTIVGDKDVIGNPDDSTSWSGEGIELEFTGGHTVAHNSISRVADGISSSLINTDIFGNDIFDVTDDGIEPDSGYANVRIWGNRVSNARHAGISFQPMNGGPWYILRNQVVAGNQALKLRESTRALIAHNVFVGWEGVQAYGSERLLNFQSNNNLWISVQDRYAWENGEGGAATWRTNLDFDGFDWGDSYYAFKWGSDQRYVDLAEFTAATGLESHGIHVDRESCFATFDIPLAPPQSMPFQFMTLADGSEAIDAGVFLANINDDFLGAAPDLGAYEKGRGLPSYGPRPVALLFEDGFESGDTGAWD